VPRQRGPSSTATSATTAKAAATINDLGLTLGAQPHCIRASFGFDWSISAGFRAVTLTWFPGVTSLQRLLMARVIRKSPRFQVIGSGWIERGFESSSETERWALTA